MKYFDIVKSLFIKEYKMKRAKMNNDKITALSCRFSKDDGANNESMSISTQENICQGVFHPKDEIPQTNEN